MPRARVAGWVFALAAVLGVGVAQLRLTPAVEPDAAWGLLAAEQRLEGRSPSLAAVTVADLDTGRDTAHSISWWAPGQQRVVYALRQAGLPLGTAVKGIVLASWLIGIAGWSLYFFLALEERGLLPWVIGAFALFRMGHYSGYVYLGGETLLWGVFPWIVVLNLRAAHSPRRAGGAAASLVAGAVTVSLVVLKHSAALLVVALALWWMMAALRAVGKRGRAAAWLAGAGFGVAVLSATGILALLTGATPASAGYCSNPPLEVAAWALGGWLVGLSDLAAAIETLARIGFAAPMPSGLIAGVSGGLGIAGLVWLLFQGRRPDPAERPVAEASRRLALVTILVISGGLLVLQARGACISFEGRHYQYGSFLALPLVVAAAREALASPRWRTRSLAAAALAMLVGFPAAYGLTALVDKACLRMPQRAAAVGQDGLRRDWLPPGASAAELDAALARRAGASPWLLATPLSTVALAYPRARLLILSSGEETQISGRPDGTLVMLLPAGAGQAEAQRLRHRFRDVLGWERIPLPAPGGPGVWIARFTSPRDPGSR